MQQSVTLRPITPSADSQVWKFVEHLYLSAFPAEERRETNEWHRLAETDERFQVHAINLGKEVKGFISVWTFPTFRYVEHFAVSTTKRNAGIGSTSLQLLLSADEKPVVLEVELPENDLACRRIAFYRRNGFFPSNQPYVQPPYSPVLSSVEMLVLSTSPSFLEENWDEIVRTLHREVYVVE